MKYLILLIFSASCLAQTSDWVKYSAEALYFGGSSGYMVYAQAHGRDLCKMEDRRAGYPQLFNTSDAFGREPVYWRTYVPAIAVESAALILQLTRHKKIARGLLVGGGTFQYGVAAATHWAGCN